MAILDGFISLFSKTNDAPGQSSDDTSQGVVSDLLPELTLNMDDSELLTLATKWKKRYESYTQEKGISEKQEENKRYWLGKHGEKADDQVKGLRPVQENRIFTDVETFLPIATRQNPEPLVSGGDSEAGQLLSDKVAKMLAYQADIQKLKLKVKKATRHWMIYLIGVCKFGWDNVKNDLSTRVILPSKIILDPDSTIDEEGYSGTYIGEYKEDTAANLQAMFPKVKDDITKLTEKNKGTKIRYIEWWTHEYVFWSLDEKLVLDKMKNPHWNYEDEIIEKDLYGQPLYGEDGKPRVRKVQLRNHFNHPRMPYSFLGVFSTGEQPHDENSLIQQNIPVQNQLNNRLKQIDKNVNEMNAGAVVSGKYCNQEEAQQVANAIKSGKTGWIPDGDVNQAYRRDSGVSLPADVYNSVQDLRSQMDNLFGIHGTTRGERSGPETLGGRILMKSSDVDRISFVSDYIEQFVDDIYNYWTQLMYVYYTEEHVAHVLGSESAMEYVRLRHEEFNQTVEVKKTNGEVQSEPISLLVSVREGSLIPKDPIVRRNEAVELFKMGALDPITMFENLDYPNPREAAKKLWMWKNAPEKLFPELAEELAPEEPVIPAGAPAGTPAPEIKEGMKNILDLQGAGML